MNSEHQAVFGMAEPSNAAVTVELLQARYNYLGEGLEHCDTMEAAQPLEAERRILLATLTAIKAEYAPGYFDSTRHQAAVAP